MPAKSAATSQLAQPTDQPMVTQNTAPVQTQNTSQYANSNAGAGLGSNQVVQQATPGEYAVAPSPASGGTAKNEANQTQSKAAQESVTTTAEQPRKRDAALDDRERSAKRGRDERSDEDEARLHGPSRSLSAHRMSMAYFSL